MTTKEQFVEMAKGITRNVKDDTTGQWTKVPFYKFEPKDSVGCDSHGSLSCYRIMATGMPLSVNNPA